MPLYGREESGQRYYRTHLQHQTKRYEDDLMQCESGRVSRVVTLLANLSQPGIQNRFLKLCPVLKLKLVRNKF